MLILLILVYFTHDIAHGLAIPIGKTSDTLSTQLDEGYFDDRTILSMVWSCLATLVACSWVAVHPNVPSAKDSNARILGRRLAMMGYMLLAPELVIYWAAKQHLSAKEIAARYQG